ncbi:unnamed protein product [Camellia sinensis]
MVSNTHWPSKRRPGAWSSLLCTTSKMSNQSQGDDSADTMAKAMKASDDLYNIRDSYFPSNPDDKISRLQSDSDLALKLLDSIPSANLKNVGTFGNTTKGFENLALEQRKLPMQRATYEYLRGKILDVFPDYRKEAEDHLSKAVSQKKSFNPGCFMCCTAKAEGYVLKLADVIPGEVESISGRCLAMLSCTKQGSKQKDTLSIIYARKKNGSRSGMFGPFIYMRLYSGQNRTVWAAAAQTIRAEGSLTTAIFAEDNLGADNQAEIVEESIKHAKEAIMLDVKDGNSWYNLGNAWLTFFFVTGAWDHSKLLQSLKAYQNAEKDESMNSNPDLSFNCATQVNKYLENYERALTNFESAASRDPGLNAAEEAHKIVNLLDKLESLLRGQTKTKRLVSLASSLAAVNLNPSYRRATIDSLSEGLNKQVAIIGKVLFFVKHENVAPLYYLVCDSNHFCYVLSVYGIRDDAIKEGDQLTLVEPNYRNVDFSWKGKFRSVRVDFLEQVLVNGKALSFQQAVRSSIHAQHKP